jgi:hypothetical protein
LALNDKGEVMLMSNGATSSVIRGQKSWAYIYIALGFILSIEGTIVGLVTPLSFPWNLILYLALGSITAWLFIDCGWFQNKLMAMKARYEQKEH